MQAFKTFVTFLLLSILTPTTQAQQSVSVLFPYAAGSSTDLAVRKMADQLSGKDFAYTVIPTPGAAGLVAINALINSQSRAVAVIGNGLLTFKDIDIVKDIRPVVLIGYEPTVIAVRADSPYQNLRDLHEAARTKPIYYGSSGVGSYGHYSSSIVANRNANIVHVPFRSTGQAVPELLSGRLDFLVMDETLIDRFVKSGQLRPIAANYHRRLLSFPNVATFAEQGVDNKNFYRWEIVVAKPDTDPKMIAQIQAYFNDPAVRNELTKINIRPENVQLDTFIQMQQQIMESVKRDFVVP